jgi:hypothetical protein
VKAKLLYEMRREAPSLEFPDAVLPAGTVIDHPDAYLLVQLGCAVPADEECQKRHGRTPDQLAAAQHAYRRVSAGIAPEDYEAFDEGIMAGYTPDGEWIPGPAMVEDADAGGEEVAANG